VRAVLLTGHGSSIVIARHRPGRAAYRVLPGGAVEATAPSPEAALARQLHEELGAHAVIGPRLATITAAMHDATTAIQHLHLARLVTLDPAPATTPEYTDPATGTYTRGWCLSSDELASSVRLLRDVLAAHWELGCRPGARGFPQGRPYDLVRDRERGALG
jgi:8-oxo-dGTP pyrophosphatase MutT (NUDIX family)